MLTSIKLSNATLGIARSHRRTFELELKVRASFSGSSVNRVLLLLPLLVVAAPELLSCRLSVAAALLLPDCWSTTVCSSDAPSSPAPPPCKQLST